MLTGFERYLLVTYLANAASNLQPADPEARKLARWLPQWADRAALPTRIGPFGLHFAARDKSIDAPSSQELAHLAEDLREMYDSGPAMPDRTAQRLERLGTKRKLDRIEIDILQLLLRSRTQPIIESMVDDIFDCRTPIAHCFNLGSRALPVNGRSKNGATVAV